jgi:hypothetical protein
MFVWAAFSHMVLFGVSSTPEPNEDKVFAELRR